MRELIRPVACVVSAACLAFSFSAVSPRDALAQAKQAPPPQAAPQQPQQPPQFKQVVLTDKQIEGALAAAKEMDPITAKMPDNVRPDPRITAQLDAIAKKNGFANYAEYNNVVDNISLVLGGVDPQSKKYVGPEAVIKMQIAQVQADKKMPANDKNEALADLNQALKSPPPPVDEQRQYRSGDQVLRQAGRHAWRQRPAVSLHSAPTFA